MTVPRARARRYRWTFAPTLPAHRPRPLMTGSERLELIQRARRLCGLLGATALLRSDVDDDGDIVLRDLDGAPVAMVRPDLDGSLIRVF